MLDGIGVSRGRSFKPDDRTRAILDAAAKTAYKTSRVIGLQDGANGVEFRVYPDRKWLNPVNNMKSRWPKSTTDLSFAERGSGFRALDSRIWFFTDYYSISPGMVSMTPGEGAVLHDRLRGRRWRPSRRRPELQGEPAEGYSRRAILVGHALRSGERVRPRQWPTVPVAGQAG